MRLRKVLSWFGPPENITPEAAARYLELRRTGVLRPLPPRIQKRFDDAAEKALRGVGKGWTHTTTITCDRCVRRQPHAICSDRSRKP